MKVTDLTCDEINAVAESCCEACKGVLYMHHVDCYLTCDGFAESVKEHDEEGYFDEDKQ